MRLLRFARNDFNFNCSNIPILDLWDSLGVPYSAGNPEMELNSKVFVSTKYLESIGT